MKAITVYDGLVPEKLVHEVYHVLRNTGFKTVEKDYPELDDDQKMLSANLDISHPTIYALAEAIHHKIPNNDDFVLDRVYANAYTSSDSPRPHQDSLASDGITIIYYANPEWDWSYGGETVFFDLGSQDTNKAVLPKAGRFVIFDPFLFHCARPQNNIGPKFRYTVVFKLKYKATL